MVSVPRLRPRLLVPTDQPSAGVARVEEATGTRKPWGPPSVSGTPFGVPQLSSSARGRFQRLVGTGQIPAESLTPQGRAPAPGARLDGSAFQNVVTLRRASFDEYAQHYLAREIDKGFSHDRLPATPAERRQHMETHAKGKMREWFPDADWYVVRIETPEALSHLMMLDSQVTRGERLVRDGVPRLLGWGVKHAKETRYFEEATPHRQRHHDYYEVFSKGAMTLKGSNKLVLTTLDGERSQVQDTVLYYLHDGFGRALPYLTLVDRKIIPFEPVEALLAVRR